MRLTPPRPSNRVGAAALAGADEAGVTLATWFPLFSVIQRLPSGPAVIPLGLLLAVGIEYSVEEPALVTEATLLVAPSVNQRFPSGPSVMRLGLLDAVGIVYSVKVDGASRLPTLSCGALREPDSSPRRRDAQWVAGRCGNGVLGEGAR